MLHRCRWTRISNFLGCQIDGVFPRFFQVFRLSLSVNSAGEEEVLGALGAGKAPGDRIFFGFDGQRVNGSTPGWVLGTGGWPFDDPSDLMVILLDLEYWSSAGTVNTDPKLKQSISIVRNPIWCQNMLKHNHINVGIVIINHPPNHHKWVVQTIQKWVVYYCHTHIFKTIPWISGTKVDGKIAATGGSQNAWNSEKNCHGFPGTVHDVVRCGEIRPLNDSKMYHGASSLQV